MPGESFYEGLTLADRLRKFVDYHADTKYRHISAYEARMLDTASVRLEQTLDIARQAARQELEEVRARLSQVYETLIYGEGHIISVVSIPTGWSADPVSILHGNGLIPLSEDPSPLHVQAALAALLTESGNDLQGRFSSLATDSRLIERQLDPETLALLNRVMYLPSVIAENSWADVAPLLEHLDKARGKGAPVFLFGGTLVGTGSLVIAFIAGGSVIALQLLQHVADGMAPGLRGLGERLTAGWRRGDGTDQPNVVE
jgi:hypothetical protein